MQASPDKHQVSPVWVSLAVTALFFVVIQVVALLSAGGFEYPLDDVYIHLAMAEEIARGGYGVNVGELASAASSPLYPLFLLPIGGPSVQVWLPLVWNVLAMLGAAYLWARIMIEAFGAGRIAVAMAVIGPLGLNFAGLAFTGMEHAFHLLATLSVLLGLQQYFATGRLTPWLFAGVIFGPLIRFEGLAVSMSAALILLIQARPHIALLLAVLSVVPLLVFSGMLVAMGLDPLPNSVNAKLAGHVTHQTLSGDVFGAVVLNKLDTLPGLILGVGVLVAGFALLWTRRIAFQTNAGALVVAALFAGAGHLALGQIGWMNRYEIYSLAFLIGTLLLAAGMVGGWTRKISAIGGMAVLVLLAVFYTSSLFHQHINTPRAILLQQGQMERFVDDFHQGSVAVNDLGKVAHNNDHYVLDLWGLASKTALDLRQSRPGQGWADPLVAEHNVDLVMIYQNWLEDAVGSDWQKLGVLRLTVPVGALGSPEVTFYATDAQAAETLRAKLPAFVDTLPNGAVFDFAEEG